MNLMDARYFSLDVYSDNKEFNFLFKISSDNKNLEDCLYKAYMLLVMNLYDTLRNDISFETSRDKKARFLDTFEIYLNEIIKDENGNEFSVPIFTSTDEAMMAVLLTCSDIFLFADNKTGDSYTLTNFINMLEYEYHHGYKRLSEKNKFSIDWFGLPRPSWLAKISDIPDIIKTLLSFYDPTSNKYTFGLNLVIYDWHYTIVFISDDWYSLISNIILEAHNILVKG